ncbi:MAG TPA: hypothetical protein VHV47_06280 [Opitutaceae bacterium]|nr:hypothetical protein [Opitutaceae bacterium]
MWGWGRLLGREFSPPLTAALGLALVLLGGGLLNLAHCARPLALDLLVLGGLLAAAAGAWRGRVLGFGFGRWPAAVPLLLLGVLLGLRLAPPAAFDVFDDFEKYFAVPARMLATGTVGGNRLSAIGSETLGGQAFLQGFALAHLPPAWIGAVDSSFCLLLCVALAGFAGRPRGWIAAAAAELAVFALNPQIINISAVYSGAALILAAVFLPAERPAGRRTDLLLGLLYAGMIALKTTFAAFVAAHLLAAAAAVLIRDGAAGRAAKSLAARLGWTVLFLAPWILVSLPSYLAGLKQTLPLPPPVNREPLALFSTAPELYGATQLHYTALALAAWLAAGAGLIALRRHRASAPPATAEAAAALLAAGGVYFLLTLVLAPAAFGREGATRYAGPILIGTVPAALRLLLAGGFSLGRGRAWRLAPLAAALAVAAFAPSAAARVAQIIRYGSNLAFTPSATSAAYRAYNRTVLEGPVRGKLASVQALVPPGEPFVAWIAAPFWLDFRRNPVIETNAAGLGARWAWPPAVRYYLWEYRGYAIPYSDRDVAGAGGYGRLFYGEGAVDRINTVRSLAFAQYLEHRAAQADILYNDGSLVLFRTR